ncbi:MAG: hypothetical protein GQ468_05400 [Candidatus Scalindua sp.]|nr:hypothetical protein [Candidatus Scalindua sp.]
MSAGTILVANSTVVNGSTAWVHLNNQAGGGGGTVIIIGGDRTANIGLVISANMGQALSTNVNNPTLEAGIGLVLSANIDWTNLKANICQE